MATTNNDNSDIVIAIYDNTWEFLDFNGFNACEVHILAEDTFFSHSAFFGYHPQYANDFSNSSLMLCLW